jgi:hypothetical protein
MRLRQSSAEERVFAALLLRGDHKRRLISDGSKKLPPLKPPKRRDALDQGDADPPVKSPAIPRIVSASISRVTNALRLARFLPEAERGPVLLRALARLAVGRELPLVTERVEQLGENAPPLLTEGAEQLEEDAFSAPR